MLEEMMLEKKVWVVVGASQNPERYGHSIYKKLKERGYRVYPVSPNYDNINGDKCYKSISDLPEMPEVINMVVSPKHGMDVIDEAAKLNIRNIWLQPGTYNDELLDKIKENDLTAVQACVLVALR